MKSAWGCAGLLAAVAVAFAPVPGAGAVTFGPPSYVGVWGDPFAIETPDLNGDGHPDLVAGIAGQVGSEVVTLLGNGHGGFGHEEQYEEQGGAVFGLAVADLDGSGNLGVATVVNGAPGGKDVGVLLGEGGGFFKKGAASYFSAGETPLAIAAAPFTGKALPDLVVGNFGSNSVSLLENLSKPGTASFAAAKEFPNGHSPAALAVADFNRDGIPDVVVADSDEGGKEAGFTILDGTGKASGLKEVGFTKLGINIGGRRGRRLQRRRLPRPGVRQLRGRPLPQRRRVCPDEQQTRRIRSADDLRHRGRTLSIASAEIDGRTDLLVGEEGTFLEEGRVLLLANNGSGSFSEAGRFSTEEGWGPVLGTDLTGDGAADVLEGDSNGTVATLLDIGQASPTPSSLSFGSVTRGQESAPQSVTITNTGAAPTTVEGLALAGGSPGAFDLDDGGLALGAGTCAGASLAPGASCSANVAFRPTSTGPISASLLVFTEGAATPASIALGGTGAPAASPPLPLLPAPTITAVHQTASIWREGSKLARISKNKKPPVGTTFSFALNEQATVGLAFTTQAGGRKVAGRCLAPSAKNRHRPACKRTVVAGTLSITGHSATNKIAFEGRLTHTRKLAPGHYRLLITAINAAGARSATASLSFTVVS